MGNVHLSGAPLPVRVRPAPAHTRAEAQRQQRAGACAICSEAGCTARPYGCEHYFHADCLLQWSMRESSCPICRHFFNYVMCSKTGMYYVHDAVQHDASDEDEP